ncbi:hypothetical protein GJ496_000559 [Pomphorhynchus laevis]|nr:hypothetical protein GJ496_000559 [Pomphorhynchus laevis]
MGNGILHYKRANQNINASECTFEARLLNWPGKDDISPGNCIITMIADELIVKRKDKHVVVPIKSIRRYGSRDKIFLLELSSTFCNQSGTCFVSFICDYAKQLTECIDKITEDCGIDNQPVIEHQSPPPPYQADSTMINDTSEYLNYVDLTPNQMYTRIDSIATQCLLSMPHNSRPCDNDF